MRLFLLQVLILLLFSCNYRGPGAPTGLLCELLSNPEQAVITDKNPEFGWIVNDKRRGAEQSAYQILVASDKHTIDKDMGNFWDSGKIDTDQSVNVEYQGKPLESNKAYWWKVRTWDQNDRPSLYSEPQRFNTGDPEPVERKWPEESRWIKMKSDLDESWVFENRHPVSYHEIKPSQVTKKEKGHYFIDFGRSAFATLKLTLTNNTECDSIEILLGEKKKKNNTVNQEPGGSIGFQKYILKLREGTHTYIVELPRKISHYPNSQILEAHMPEVTPFRYAEIIGSPSIIKMPDIIQYALFYQFNENAAEFYCDNQDLNAVYALCKYTLKVTPFMGLYVDGSRERMPYEADAYIQQLGHYAVDREYAIQRYTWQFLIFNPSWPTEWHLHIVPMAWADYIQTGNKEFIEKYYSDLKSKTLLVLIREDGLISTKTGLLNHEVLSSLHYNGNSFRDIVDWPQAGDFKSWPPGETDNYIFCPINTVVNAFHYRNLVLMGKIAHLVGKHEDFTFFKERAKMVRESLNRLLFDGQRGIYVDGDTTNHSSLHSNLFPLVFGIVPQVNKKSVIEFIKSRDMACSPYGAQYLLEALYEEGESQYALDLMTSNSDRSWLNMIRIGSTVTTEAWDKKYKNNLTWNHAWSTSPANIIPRKLFGIEAIEPTFRRLKIKPQPANLKNAYIKLPTIRGNVVCKWTITDEKYNFKVTIPANSSALVYLPKNDPAKILEGNKPIEQVKDIIYVGNDESSSIIEIPAGNFTFESDYKVIPVKPMVEIPMFIPYDTIISGKNIKINIECETEGAEIRYSLNGRKPTKESMLYIAPFEISENTYVSAKTFKEGYRPSQIMTSFYKFVEPVHSVNQLE